jgi:molybdopterin converting factor small subunit
MFKCTIHLYGLPHEITDLTQAEFELEKGANLRQVVAALRNIIPSLEGPVIRKGEDRLMDLYKFNVNGRFYYDDDMDLQINQDDRIALLTPITGG